MNDAPPFNRGMGSEASVTEWRGDIGDNPSVFGSLAAIFSIQVQTVGRFWDLVVVGTHTLRTRERVNPLYEYVFGFRGYDRPDGERELAVKMSRERK